MDVYTLVNPINGHVLRRALYNPFRKRSGPQKGLIKATATTLAKADQHLERVVQSCPLWRRLSLLIYF